MAKARPIPGLLPDTTFREAAARAVEIRTDELFEHAGRVLDTDDIEGVHDMRVASRRLRAALEVCAACFPQKPYGKALREVKRLADALGERRDPDVHIAAIEREAAALDDRDGVDEIVAELRARQQDANASLAEALDRAQRGRLHERLLVLAAEARGL